MDHTEFRRVVDAERAATEARVASLRSEVDGIVAAASDANADDEHDPEGSTIAFERARAAALLAAAEAHLRELDRALARLEDGTFSTCQRCGGPIAPDRLAARPGAGTCLECATSARPR